MRKVRRTIRYSPKNLSLRLGHAASLNQFLFVLKLKLEERLHDLHTFVCLSLMSS